MYAAALMYEHFSKEEHHSFWEDLLVTQIEPLLNPLRRGNYWRGTLKTLTLWALDVEDFV